MTKLTILLLLIALAAIPIIAGQIFPGWGAFIILVSEITLILAFAPRLIAKLIKQRLIRMFKERSRTLEGASVEVHGVKEIGAEEFEPDASAEEQGSECRAQRHVEVDFTLRPTGAGQYAPRDLGLVAANAPAPDEAEEATSDEPAAYAQRVRLVSADGEHECDQLSGEARLRIVFGLPNGLWEDAQFRYFFARFARVRLP